MNKMLIYGKCIRGAKIALLSLEECYEVKVDAGANEVFIRANSLKEAINIFKEEEKKICRNII